MTCGKEGSLKIVTAANPTGYPWRVITICVTSQVDTTNHLSEREALDAAEAEISEARQGRNDITEARVLRWDVDLWRLAKRLTL